MLQMELGALPLANAGVRPDGVQPMSQGVQNGLQPVKTTKQVHGITTTEKHTIFSAICPSWSSTLVDRCFSGWDCTLDWTLRQVTCDARLGPGWERRRLPCCWGKERRFGCKAEETNRDKSDQTSSFISTEAAEHHSAQERLMMLWMGSVSQLLFKIWAFQPLRNADGSELDYKKGKVLFSGFLAWNGQ